MASDFQALPPRPRSEETPSPYDRYAEVNLRKPEREGFGVPWRVISVVAAFISMGLILLAVVSMNMWSAAPPPAPMPVVTPVNVLGDEEVAALKGTWVASALTIDGDQATDDEVAQVKLTLDLNGFKLVLPTSQHSGSGWRLMTDIVPRGGAKSEKKIDLCADGDVTLQGICEIEGETMKLCLSQEDGPRPTDFASKKDSKRVLIILNRQKQER